ncbi:hypothetical protein ACFV6F_14950 [Kitasatospora phosalacinea]|uniref:hypothetical protein n=1 Tax=Kitasatospora phosalacinea TaxID=2065 RepID=UPI003666069B
MRRLLIPAGAVLAAVAMTVVTSGSGHAATGKIEIGWYNDKGRVLKVIDNPKGCYNLNQDIGMGPNDSTHFGDMDVTNLSSGKVTLWKSANCKGNSGGTVNYGDDNYKFARNGWSVSVS